MPRLALPRRSPPKRSALCPALALSLSAVHSDTQRQHANCQKAVVKY